MLLHHLHPCQHHRSHLHPQSIFDKIYIFYLFKNGNYKKENNKQAGRMISTITIHDHQFLNLKH